MRKLIVLFITAVLVHAESDAISTYLKNIKVGDPVEYKNLKIFPLIANKTLSIQNYVTLDQASDQKWIQIKEVGAGNVNSVQIKNNGTSMVFILTGEMISGAKQDRMLKEDVLLPPKSGWIEVPVYCVEHGRWTSVSGEFKSEKLLVPNAVRQAAKLSESQSEVWDEIASSQDKLGIASETRTVRANYEDAKLQKKIDEYTGKFDKLPSLSKSTIGVVVSTGDQIICFDLFANNSLLSKYWKKLLKSYAMDGISGTKSTIDTEIVKSLCEALAGVNQVSQGTPGRGDLIKLTADFGRGSALVYGSAVIHMDFFPTADLINDDSGMRLDFRRDQRLTR